MKHHPIIFSGPMVRALLSGSKTQTRRILKPQPTHFNPVGVPRYASPHGPSAMINCPYGQPGDQLWVREAWDFLPDGVLANGKATTEPNQAVIRFWADTALEFRAVPEDFNPMIYNTEKVRPSIHMPRWASRITLEITGVRVERLQEISEADAKAEGAEALHWDGNAGPADLIDWSLKEAKNPYRNGYALLWDSINGDGAWAANPWVWVVEFKRLGAA